jgi:photosystem II stability/assembly factor-like uncharacterized protein
MKRFAFLLSVMIMAIVFNGCKKEDNPAPAERKQYAWVAGMVDSTGYGLILFSADGGETWVRQGNGMPSLLGVNVIDIWAVDEQTVWAVGTGNVILKTLDGGNTWMQVPAPVNDPNTELMSVCIVNRTGIWISGSGGSVYRSADNGNTWTMFDTAFFHNGGMQGIWAITSQKVYVVGGIGNGNERGFIGCTSDGGSTWDSVFPSGDFNRHEWIGVTASGNTIVVYGGKSYYMVSTDGGTTWKNDSTEAAGGGGGADINHLIMLNPATWWGALDMGHIYLTNDGGSSWIPQETGQGGAFLVGIDAWNSQLALAVGTMAGWPPHGTILKTLNGGTTWAVKQSYTANLNKVTFIKQ